MTAPSSISLSLEEYEALISLAQQSTLNPDGSLNQTKAAQLAAFLAQIERENNITRYSLWVRWQDPNAPLPPGIRFPETWPPNLQRFIQFLTRPIAQSDVMQAVTAMTANPQNIMVTPDPAGLVGWTQLAAYFVNP
jgi:hypothetical protein